MKDDLDELFAGEPDGAPMGDAPAAETPAGEGAPPAPAEEIAPEPARAGEPAEPMVPLKALTAERAKRREAERRATERAAAGGADLPQPPPPERLVDPNAVDERGQRLFPQGASDPAYWAAVGYAEAQFEQAAKARMEEHRTIVSREQEVAWSVADRMAEVPEMAAGREYLERALSGANIPFSPVLVDVTQSNPFADVILNHIAANGLIERFHQLSPPDQRLQVRAWSEELAAALAAARTSAVPDQRPQPGPQTPQTPPAPARPTPPPTYGATPGRGVAETPALNEDQAFEALFESPKRRR